MDIDEIKTNPGSSHETLNTKLGGGEGSGSSKSPNLNDTFVSTNHARVFRCSFHHSLLGGGQPSSIEGTLTHDRRTCCLLEDTQAQWMAP